MPVELQTLKDENQRWNEQHADWVSEVKKWQRESRRLSALLNLLDKALPEASSMLNKHIESIEKHEEMVAGYECDLETQCIKTSNSYKTEDEQNAFHETLYQLHNDVEQEHEMLKQTFICEMKQFRKLAKELLKQTVID